MTALDQPSLGAKIATSGEIRAETRRGRPGRRRPLVGAALGALLASGAALALTGEGGAGGGGLPTVTVDIRHSRFVQDRVAVPEGSEVRFVVRNHDPIRHEFIVGNTEVHARHESGTEPYHDTVPGEVTIDAGGSAETTYRFERPGDVVFACHLPGHLAYGMTGVVEVG